MHKNILWFIFVILCIYFSVVFCEETADVNAMSSKDTYDLLRSVSMEMEEQGRTRRKHRYHLYHLWGFYGLAIAYFIKVGVAIVAFFVGSAIYLGFRYLWPRKCEGAIYKEAPIVLDHAPSFVHHDHIPYSFGHDHFHDHHFDTSSWGSSGPTSFGPYSAYSGSGSSITISDGPDGPPETISSDSHTLRRKRGTTRRNVMNKIAKRTEHQQQQQQQQQQTDITEQRIGEFVFNFLGLDTSACRRRFICEMEFKSKLNPLTSMAFRMVGHTFFVKYINERNEFGKANTFGECAVVNSECVFIENPDADESQEQQQQQDDHTQTEQETADHDDETNDTNTELPAEDNSLESNDLIEKENENNLKAELRRNSYRRRTRGDRYLKFV